MALLIVGFALLFSLFLVGWTISPGGGGMTEKIEPANKIAVSPSEAAALRSIDRTTFYRKTMPLVREGTIRSLRVGQSQRIFVDSLRA